MANPLGSTPGIIVGVGVGQAASAAIEPAIEPARQQAWKNNKNRILDPATMARLVAQGGVSIDAAHEDGEREGLTSDKIDALVYLSQTVPGVGEALRILRRNPAFADLFAHSLAKQGIDTRYHPGLTDLQHERLDPAVIALAIVRGIMDDPGFLPVGPPTASGKVQAFPTSKIPTLKEAEAAGWDRDRLFVQTAISGRPMAVIDAAHATFRDILEKVDYQRAVAEGDVRNEWAEAIFELARSIPSVSDYVQAHLRGWITEREMNDGTARHGMSPADTHLLYLRAGRPAAPGQMATAAARGIDGPDGKPMNRAQFLKGIAESDVRPEWGPMLWDSRFLYPPLFQLSRLVQSGTIDADTAAEWAKKDRYAPEVVTALHASWNQTAPAKADPHVVKAETQLWNTTHRSYLDREITDAQARRALGSAGVAAAAIGNVLTIWGNERDLIRKALTPANIKRAFAKGGKNAATGQTWTRDEAIAALVALGYAVHTANDFLDIP